MRSCRRFRELAYSCDMAVTVKGEMPRWQISKEEVVTEPESEIFDISYEFGGDKNMHWRLGIGWGDEGFLENGFDAW
jgi:hypothetical protein